MAKNRFPMKGDYWRHRSAKDGDRAFQVVELRTQNRGGVIVEQVVLEHKLGQPLSYQDLWDKYTFVKPGKITPKKGYAGDLGDLSAMIPKTKDKPNITKNVSQNDDSDKNVDTVIQDDNSYTEQKVQELTSNITDLQNEVDKYKKQADKFENQYNLVCKAIESEIERGTELQDKIDELESKVGKLDTTTNSGAFIKLWTSLNDGEEMTEELLETLKSDLGRYKIDGQEFLENLVTSKTTLLYSLLEFMLKKN